MKKIEFISLKDQYNVLKKEIDVAIERCIDSAAFIQGQEVHELESVLGKYTDSKCLSVANGTDALIISLMALGIGPGDEVIAPSFTWVSTVEAIKIVGATPVYIDICEDTFNLDVSLLPELITPRTKTIIAVSLFGRCANLSKIMNFAESHNLSVIEDSAQAFGSKSDGIISCSLCDFSTTSFFPAKPLGCYGDGGAIFTKSEELYDRASIISKNGQKGRYNCLEVGLNSRLDTLQAAILLEKFKIYEDEIIKRDFIAQKYFDSLSSYKNIKIPKIPNKDNRSVWAQYTIILSNPAGPKRDSFMKFLSLNGVPTNLYYPKPIHLEGPYKDGSVLPVTEDLANKVVSIPMHPYLNEEQILHICSTIQESLS